MAGGSKKQAEPGQLAQNLQMAGALLGFIGTICLLVSFFGGGGGECVAPVTTDLKWGLANDNWDMAEHICCHNTQFAEPSGFFQREGLFGKLRQEKTGSTITFYDSVCGLPLFEAPVGRSMSAFEEESIAHGWPSFRPAELIAENVIIHTGGRMSSTCGTHLGHNLPDFSGDRYCIDLVCIAGTSSLSNGSSVGLASAGSSFSWSVTESAYLCFALAVLSCALSNRITDCVENRRRGRTAGVSMKEDLEPGMQLQQEQQPH
jgi:peptide methionine sulfoxide reductase MsrB